MLFTFLLVVHFVIALALVTVILMQKSEGGGLTGGGSPAGLMSARGAADFLTRSTAILAVGFVVLSIILAVLAATRHGTSVDTTLNRVAPVAPAPSAAQPLPGGFGQTGNSAAGIGGASNATQPGAITPQENGATPKK